MTREPLTAGRTHRGRGYSLIELLVVIAVLGIIAGIGMIALFHALEKSRQRATMADMRSVSKAIEAYSVDHGFLPGSTGSVSALVTLLIPYQTTTVPSRDQWGNDLFYERDADGNYTVISLGKDGVDGADLTYDTRSEFERDIVLANGHFIAAAE